MLAVGFHDIAGSFILLAANDIDIVFDLFQRMYNIYIRLAGNNTGEKIFPFTIVKMS